MKNHYYIMYNPLMFNLIDKIGKDIHTPIDLLSCITGRDATLLNEKNYLEYLQFDLSIERSNRIKYFPYENYGSYYIANQVSKADPGALVIFADGKRRSFYEIISAEKEKPRMVFITSMSSNFSAAVASAIVLNYAKIPVVLGGVHVSACPEDVDIFIRDHVPHPKLVGMVSGAGDSATIRRIIADADSNSLQERYEGRITIENGIWGSDTIVPLPAVPLDPDTKMYRIKKFLDSRTRVNVTTPYLGCPYSCKFCSIASLPAYQRKFQERTAEDFINEIRDIQKDGIDFKSRYFFFYPDNILLGRKTLEEILDRIIDSDLTINFTTQVSIEVAKNEKLLDKLRRAGASCFFIGFESLDLNNLEYIGKNIATDIRKSGLSVSEYYSREIRTIQDFGITILGAFIYGLPYDYFNSFDDHTGRDVAEFCIANNIGYQSSCINDLPGSFNFRESQANGTYLYGKTGTMDYLLSLSVSDLMEPNTKLSASLKHSPLVAVYMSYDSISRVYSGNDTYGSAFALAAKSWNYPTKSGKKSLKHRIIDTVSTFGMQVAMSSYRNFYDSLVTSRGNYTGIFERLWERESDPEVRSLFRDYVAAFKK